MIVSKSITRSILKEVPAAIQKVRLAELSDAPLILPICTDPMQKTFRVFTVEDIEYLIESSVLAISQLNVKEEIIGFLALREYPLIPALDPMAWEEYVWTKYKTIELNARNTMWIHMICWKKEYARDVVDAMLKSVYMHDPYTHYIAMTKSVLSCPQLIPGSSRAEATFRRVQSMERGMPGDKLPVLLIADRKEVCPKLRVRRAVEEDNDDIVPIMDRHSERLRQLYGDFYASELVSRHPESERVLLVCEHKEMAVGVMCLNTQINFESLEECFELSPYAGLRHLDQPPHKHRSREMDSSSFVSDINADGTGDSVYNLEALSTNGLSADMLRKDKRCESQVKVSWNTDEEKNNAGDRMLYSVEDGRLIGNVSILEYLDLFTEDEDDLDFDIVNIDPMLLRVPHLISSDDPISMNCLEGRQKELDKERLDDILVPKKEKKRSLPSSSLSIPPDYIIRYSGKSNAFLLEMCAMNHEYDERYAFDMLEAAFELFPGRDYCVMCLPSSHSPFPLLEHFTMVTPHSTRMRFINESLYVAHINSVKGDVSVRPAEMADMETVVDLVEHSAKAEALHSLFQESLKSCVLHSFMLLAQRQPIGIAIVGPFMDGISFRIQYDLSPEPNVQLADGAIIGATMSPAMEPHARWYMRDIMRQTRYDTLFWICQPFAKGEKCPNRNMMSLTERMIPVRPRGSLPNISGYKLVDRLFKDLSTPYALWMMEKRFTSYPKINVNNNIVVVGASRTGLAFIEALILGDTAKYITFTNLSLVSEHGVPTVPGCLKAADTAIPREGRYTDTYMKSVPFCFYVDVIPAVLEEIDRKKKCIYLKGGGIKYYDELVLTCGQQFQHPDYLKASLQRVKEVRKGKPCERVLMDNPKYHPDQVPPAPAMPENLYLINSLLQANVVFSKLLKRLTDHRAELTSKNRIVVFGDCLEAYCCISALLELGVGGHEIAFVENYPPEDFNACRINCFNDEPIDERVQESMEGLGVKTYRRCRLTKLHIHLNNVSGLSLMDALHLIKFTCFALFYYGLKAIDINAFKAINECGLVYDGGLVVGPSFETNDPHIFGAGTCCNYSRRLYAANCNHKYYNSEEVGEALADLFLHRFNPFINYNPEYSTVDLLPQYNSATYCRSHSSIPDVNPSRLHLIQSLGWKPVIKFTKPIVKAATLPGPLQYMKARKPGPDIPMEVQLNLPHQGHTLITDKNEKYFRIRLNVLHVIDAITCLSKEPFSAELLSQLYGKHEALFNRLLVRYQMKQIEDFYTFFIQPWMSGIYQEPFDELIDNINNQEVGAIFEKMKSKYALFGDENKTELTSTCYTEEKCQEEAKAKKMPETLRNVVGDYATRTSVQMERARGPSDIPSECGQNVSMREEIGAFWDAIGGERIVYSHIARYIAKYNVPNPHYAPPNPDFY